MKSALLNNGVDLIGSLLKLEIEVQRSSARYRLQEGLRRWGWWGL